MIKVNLNNKKYNFIDKNTVDLFSISYGSINVNRKDHMGIKFYYTDYIYLDDDDIDVTPLHLTVNDVYGYFQENNHKKYFNIDTFYNNKKILQRYSLFWDDVKDHIEKVGGSPSSKYAKDNTTIKFDTKHTIPINKVLKSNITLLLKTVIEIDFNYYPQLFSDSCEYYEPL